MDYTYDMYTKLVGLLKENGYSFCGYNDCDGLDKPVIMRHDLDFSIVFSRKIAQMENEQGISATYFVLLTSDFYNAFSRKSRDMLKELQSLGHTIGLHFDRKAYGDDFTHADKDYQSRVNQEIGRLSDILGKQVDCISMHKPLTSEIAYDLRFNNVVNAYAKKFFSEFKYFSDSTMRWREDVCAGITSGQYQKLQILTHPIWYADYMANISERLIRFVSCAGHERYKAIAENFPYFDCGEGKQ